MLTYPKPNFLTFGQYIKCVPPQKELVISREFGEVSMSEMVGGLKFQRFVLINIHPTKCGGI